MVKIRLVMLWLMAVMMLVGCAASRKVEQGSSEQRRDSVVSIVMDSVVKSEISTDSTFVSATDESHTTSTMTGKGGNEETITKDIKTANRWDKIFPIILLINIIGICQWLYNKK